MKCREGIKDSQRRNLVSSRKYCEQGREIWEACAIKKWSFHVRQHTVGDTVLMTCRCDINYILIPSRYLTDIGLSH